MASPPVTSSCWSFYPELHEQVSEYWSFYPELHEQVSEYWSFYPELHEQVSEYWSFYPELHEGVEYWSFYPEPHVWVSEWVSIYPSIQSCMYMWVSEWVNEYLSFYPELYIWVSEWVSIHPSIQTLQPDFLSILCSVSIFKSSCPPRSPQTVKSMKTHQKTQVKSQWIVRQAHSHHLQYLDAAKSSTKDVSPPKFENTLLAPGNICASALCWESRPESL